MSCQHSEQRERTGNSAPLIGRSADMIRDAGNMAIARRRAGPGLANNVFAVYYRLLENWLGDTSLTSTTAESQRIESNYWDTAESSSVKSYHCGESRFRPSTNQLKFLPVILREGAAALVLRFRKTHDAQ